MEDEDWKTKLNQMEMEDTNFMSIENDEEDMAEREEILKEPKKSNSRLKKDRSMVNYCHSHDLAKYLKRAKNRKEGFPVLVPNGCYEVNLSQAYPKSFRVWVNSQEFQAEQWAEFLTEVKNAGHREAAATDITWTMCIISCKYEYNPTSGQNTF